MGAAELLNCLRGDGLVLTLIAGGGIHAAPRDALTDQHRGAIRAARDALVLVLQAEASCQTPTPTPPSIAIPPSTRRSGNPLMTPKQSGDCHADGLARYRDQSLHDARGAVHPPGPRRET